jgi:hypothetical protein
MRMFRLLLLKMQMEKMMEVGVLLRVEAGTVRSTSSFGLHSLIWD